MLCYGTAQLFRANTACSWMPGLGTAPDLKQAADNFVMKYDNGSFWIKKNSEIIHFVDSKLEVVCTTSWLMRWGTNYNDYAIKNKFNPLPYVVQVSKRKKISEELMKKINVSILVVLDTFGDMEVCRCCLPYVHSILSQF